MEQGGRRQLWITNTFKSNLDLIRKVFELTKAAGKQLPGTHGITLTMNIQPITQAAISRAVQSGGNMLGLDPRDGVLALCLFSTTWDNPADDDCINTVVRALNDSTIRLARDGGLWNRWINLNYAANGQDVINGYGEDNKAKLQAVSHKYGPLATF